jgi:hypothetical protein
MTYNQIHHLVPVLTQVAKKQPLGLLASGKNCYFNGKNRDSDNFGLWLAFGNVV